MQRRLLQGLLMEAEHAALYAPLRRAVNDAAALAWTTAHPTLFFPALMEEKAAEAREHFTRQQEIRE